MISLTWRSMSPGMAVSRSTPNGLSVALRTAAISATIRSVPMVEAPRQPKPPASDTAVTSGAYDTPPMPASITGCSIPRTSVSRVFMASPPSDAVGRLPRITVDVTGQTGPAREP